LWDINLLKPNDIYIYIYISKYQKEFSAFVNAIDFDDTKQTG